MTSNPHSCSCRVGRADQHHTARCTTSFYRSDGGRDAIQPSEPHRRIGWWGSLGSLLCSTCRPGKRPSRIYPGSPWSARPTLRTRFPVMLDLSSRQTPVANLPGFSLVRSTHPTNCDVTTGLVPVERRIGVLPARHGFPHVPAGLVPGERRIASLPRPPEQSHAPLGRAQWGRTASCFSGVVHPIQRSPGTSPAGTRPDIGNLRINSQSANY
jgi:hypothetical protein